MIELHDWLFDFPYLCLKLIWIKAQTLLRATWDNKMNLECWMAKLHIEAIMHSWVPSKPFFILRLFKFRRPWSVGYDHVIEGILWVYECVMKFALVKGVKQGKEKWNWIFGYIFSRPFPQGAYKTACSGPSEKRPSEIFFWGFKPLL